jgi:spore coat protein U-like protein
MYLVASSGAGALILGLFAAGPAFAAGTNTGSMQVTATVPGACSITATTLNFGTLQLTGGQTSDSPTPVQATVSYDCTTVPSGIVVGAGVNDTNAAGTNYYYALANGSSYLSYGLDVIDSGTFTAANAANPAGSGTNTTVGAAPTATSGSYTIAGQLAPSQTAVAGSYDDTVTFTATY